MWDRMADDHRNAARLAEGLAKIREVEIDPAMVQTNMVFLKFVGGCGSGLADYLKGHGILVDRWARMRLVTHLDVSANDIEKVIGAVGAFFGKRD